MPLQLKQADELQTSMEAAWAATNNLTPKLTSGSAIKAIFFAFVLTIQWVQSLILKTYNYARAATCNDGDLDTWMADYDFERLPPQFAVGQVRLTLTNTSVSPTSIPVAGTIIQTPDATIQYGLIADETLSAYDLATNSYIIPANQLFCDAAVQAVVIGSASNVQAGQLTQFFTAGIAANSVTNLDPIINGEDAESNDEFRARFVVHINSLSCATRMAILSAIVNVQQGMQAVLIENVDSLLQPERGHFLGVISPASGVANSALIAKTYMSVDAKRGFTIGFGILGAMQNNVTIGFSIRLATGAVNTVVVRNVKNAILDFVESLQPGDTLYISDLVGIARAVAGVAAVQLTPTLSPKINNVEADFTPSSIGVVRTAANLVTIGTF